MVAGAGGSVLGVVAGAGGSVLGVVAGGSVLGVVAGAGGSVLGVVAGAEESVLGVVAGAGGSDFVGGSFDIFCIVFVYCIPLVIVFFPFIMTTYPLEISISIVWLLLLYTPYVNSTNYVLFLYLNILADTKPL